MTNFERKLFLHNIFSFPLYYLQARGVHVYKKYSFEIVRSSFPQKEWQAVEIATKIMNSWNYEFMINRSLWAIGNLNPKLYMKMLNKFYDSKWHKEIEPFVILDKYRGMLVKQMAKLGTHAWNSIISETKYIY